MIRSLKLLAPVAMIAAGACAAPGFNAKVQRFQQMPAPQGQTFAVVTDDPRLRGGLEFATYADRVANHLARYGYVRAADPATASLTVRFDYGVDGGRERVRTVPGSSFGYGYGGRFGYSPWGYSRFGYSPFGYGGFGWPHYGFGRRAYLSGFHDPFLFDDWDRVERYTVYNSQIDMRIENRGTGARVFEGKAQALSTDNDLTTLVPNLIDAMFTGFPGNSGETVKITVAPPGKERRTR